jgi:hypothetical protein
MSKKNKSKQRRFLKKKQKKVLKNQKRRTEYLKEKNAEIVVFWENLNFLENWDSLQPSDLFQHIFKMNVEDWVFNIYKPQKDKDWAGLLDPQIVFDSIDETMNSIIDAWSEDTKGFTENTPEKWSFNEANQGAFMNIMEDVKGDTEEFTEEDARELMISDRSAWFVTVYSDELHDMVEKLYPYVISQVKALSYD